MLRCLPGRARGEEKSVPNIGIVIGMALVVLTTLVSSGAVLPSVAVRRQGVIARTPPRACLYAEASDADEPLDDATDWDEAMRALRARQQEEPPPVSDEQGEPAGFRLADEQNEPTGFRFESDAAGDRGTVSGSAENDERLRLLTLYGGRALTITTLSTLVFYIYVGLSGGITDGFDRFGEPIEDIRITMQREELAEREAAERAERARSLGLTNDESVRLGFYNY